MDVSKELSKDPENYRKWQVAMENGKDYEIEKLQDTVEGYLEDVVERLFDVMKSLEALQVTVNMDKMDIAKHGQDFKYQQGILDVVTELYAYVTGKRSLADDTEDVLEAIRLEVNRGVNVTTEQKAHVENEAIKGMFQ